MLRLPMPPMDILLTQVYGMVMILNLFGSVVAACMICRMEFQANAIKKMYLLPVRMPAMYLCKFVILTALLLNAVALQHMALAAIGMGPLAQGAFDARTLLSFGAYAFFTSMPVLSFMLFVSSLFENLWVSLGVGVTGFLSGMALAASDIEAFLAHPFVVMLKPAVAMCAQPDPLVAAAALAETILFLGAGLWAAKTKRYE